MFRRSSSYRGQGEQSNLGGGGKGETGQVSDGRPAEDDQSTGTSGDDRPGTHTEDGPPTDLVMLVTLAVVAGVLVFVGETFLRVLLYLISDQMQVGTIPFVEILRDNISWFFQNVGLFWAVVALAAYQGSRGIVIGGAVVVYVLDVVSALVWQLLFSLTSEPTSLPDIWNFLFPLNDVLLFLGIAMTYRLYVGKTILPGVDYRV